MVKEYILSRPSLCMYMYIVCEIIQIEMNCALIDVVLHIIPNDTEH